MGASRGPLDLGVHAVPGGLAFGVAAPAAESVELCVFARAAGAVETDRVPMERGADGAWRLTLAGAGAPFLYGLRAHGVFAPDSGSWHDPGKLLVDPRAPAITPGPAWSESLLARRFGEDTGAIAPKGLVADESFDWGDDRAPATPLHRAVIYEAHVRGLTMRHPAVPAALRGRYGALGHEAVLDHLASLGVTAIELMPVAHFVPQKPLLMSGRPNAWGYAPLGFLAPHGGYAEDPMGGQARELKAAVRALHAAGIEVIVDACLGHGMEGDADGLTLSLRGLDARAYFKHDDARRLVNLSGCGNTLDAGSRVVVDLWLDALRRFARDFRVDGFRLDLAPILGRAHDGFDPGARLFQEIAADPLLARLKWFAEPWDATLEGQAIGRFPAPFSEWNDRFRDDVRSFWRGDEGFVPRLATRLGGSSDLFASRGPLASVNFIACHDGFTLRDLVSHDRKHNDANGEGGRDGHDDNRSRNWGVEGPTDDPVVLATRDRVARSLLATVALARGVPLLGHGDEMGRTQAGNNNAYAHDSELTWVDWALDDRRAALLDFTRRALALRRERGDLTGAAFFASGGGEGGTIARWLAPEGHEMSARDWETPSRHALALLLGDGRSRTLVAVNAGAGHERFVLADSETGWDVLLHSAEPATLARDGASCTLPPGTLAVFGERPA